MNQTKDIGQLNNKKTRSTYMLSTRDPPKNKTFTQTESERMEKLFQENGHEKKLGQQYLYQTKQTSKQRP